MPNVVDFRASRRASAAARRSAPPMPRFDRIPRPSASKMLRESARLLSFSKGWPRSSPVRPADLARAGLYRMGFSDLVACFRCGGMMHRWEEGDDPAREHARHFPACARAAPLPPATQDGADSGLSPEMRSFGARLRSFASWPYTANVSPPELAYAGFYYSGYGDLVKCFSCDGHLQEWALGDSAWHEHAKWFPSCVFVGRQKGEAFVRGSTRPPAPLPGQTPQSTTAEIEHAAPSTEELLDKLEERLSCKVCMEREVSTMFVPCGHVATCGHCALSLSRCPVCRVAVKTSLRAFVV
ncbi:baculoviral IAP repeat-containing protein 7-B-like isoform X1 [Petromyzon marinus]|uniref:Inhibitor of apoptosis n=1 Tax=Petromyzon marinus TaxID=7757 RepID=A0AAJ7SJL2_PETMA|nr:putative inhibitor of apoptosis [Petromyzon marinus]